MKNQEAAISITGVLKSIKLSKTGNTMRGWVRVEKETYFTDFPVFIQNTDGVNVKKGDLVDVLGELKHSKYGPYNYEVKVKEIQHALESLDKDFSNEPIGAFEIPKSYTNNNDAGYSQPVVEMRGDTIYAEGSNSANGIENRSSEFVPTDSWNSVASKSDESVLDVTEFKKEETHLDHKTGLKMIEFPNVISNGSIPNS